MARGGTLQRQFIAAGFAKYDIAKKKDWLIAVNIPLLHPLEQPHHARAVPAPALRRDDAALFKVAGSGSP